MRRARFLLEAVAAVLFVIPARARRWVAGRQRRVVVTGWYGSETVGDVAILGQVLDEVASLEGEAQLTVTTFEPSRTARSLRELAREDSVALVATGWRSAWCHASADVLVFGGGPLMDSPSMAVWAWRAVGVRLAGGCVVIYACGIGPLRSKLGRAAVRILLRMSRLVIVRDDESAEAASELGRSPDAVTLDPAFDFAAMRPVGPGPSGDFIVTMLRVPSIPYLPSSASVEAVRKVLVTEFALGLDLIAETGLVVHGLIMNVDGADDDRLLLEAIRARMHHGDSLVVADGHHSVDHVVSTLANARVALTVRFHGLVFAAARAVPFVAIDYTEPSGKVGAAAAAFGRQSDVVPLRALDGRELARRVVAAAQGERLQPLPGLPSRREGRESAWRRLVGGVTRGSEGTVAS